MSQKIEERLTIDGYAWIDEDDGVGWAFREELDDIDPTERPPGCTPVVIEIYPVTEWYTQRQQDYERFSNISSKMNTLKEELVRVQRSLEVTGGTEK